MINQRQSTYPSREPVQTSRATSRCPTVFLAAVALAATVIFWL